MAVQALEPGHASVMWMNVVPEQPASTKNEYIRNAPGVGGWGGECTCPDGQVYQVGDENNACGSIACVGGVPGKCNRFRNNKWSNSKVICAGSTPLGLRPGTVDVGTWNMITATRDKHRITWTL